MKRKLYIILTLFLVSCGHKNLTQKTKPNDSTNDTKIEVKKTLPDLITNSCVIIISPTEKKVDSLKTLNGEDDFYTIADDNQWYIGNARIYLDSIKAKSINSESKGRLKFKLESGEISEVDLNSFDWGILLFDGKNKPIDADITTFETEYNKYMKK